MKKAGRTIVFILSIILVTWILTALFTNLLTPKSTLPEWLPALTDTTNEDTIIKQYQDYCTERISDETSTFLLPEEKQLLEVSGYIVSDDGFVCNPNAVENEDSNFYYPMLFNNNGNLDIWFIDSYGHFHFSNNLLDVIIQDIHLPIDEEESIQQELLCSNNMYSLYFVSEKSDVKVYSFGKIIKSIDLPQNSTFVGYSKTEGYIFRADSSVYAFAFTPIHEHITLRKIATDVEMVLATNYCYSIEKWSQPLLLMKSGEIKVYISDMNLDSYDDDPLAIGLTTFSGSLEDVQEGGFFIPNS